MQGKGAQSMYLLFIACSFDLFMLIITTVLATIRAKTRKGILVLPDETRQVGNETQKNVFLTSRAFQIAV